MTPSQPDQTENTPAAFTWPNALERISFGTVVLLTLATMLIVLVFWQAWELRFVLFSLLAALMLHTGMKPAVDALEKRGVQRRIGVAVVYLVLTLVLAGILVVLVPMLSRQFSALLSRVPEYYGMVRDLMFRSGIEFLTQLARLLPPPGNMQEVQDVVMDSASPSATVATTNFFITMGNVAQGFFMIVAVFAIAFYLTIDRDRLLQSWLFRMTPGKRTDVRTLVIEVESKVGGFIRGQLILCTVIGVASFAAYSLIGLPNAPALGALAFVFSAVPMIGPLLMLIPAVLVAATEGPDKILWVITAVAVLQLAENNILVPRIMDRTVGVSPIVSLVSIVAFSSLFGILGAVLAIPLAATIQVLMQSFLWSEPDEMEPEGDILDGSELKRGQRDIVRMQAVELAQDVRKQFRASSEQTDATANEIEDMIELAAMETYALLGAGDAVARNGEIGTPDAIADANTMARGRA